MKRITKNLLISSLTIIPTVGIVAPVVLLTNSNNKSKNNNESSLDSVLNNVDSLKNILSIENFVDDGSYSFIYNNKLYDSYNDVIKSFMNTGQNGIISDYYMGDIKIYDRTNNMLDMSELRKYDQNRLSPAYIMSNGQLNIKEDEAKLTYIRTSWSKEKYSDFNGNLFSTEKEAEDSILKNSVATPVLYYDIGGSKFNPLSKTDLKLFKTDIYNAATEYLKMSTETQMNQSKFYKNKYSLSIYDFSNGSNNSKVYSSVNSKSLLDKGNYSDNIINKVINKIYTTQLNYIKKNFKFDIDMSIRNIYKDKNGNITFNPSEGSWLMGSKPDYWWDHPDPLFYKWNFYYDNNWHNSIKFNEIGLENLKKFQMFLNEESFSKKKFNDNIGMSDIEVKMYDGFMPVARTHKLALGKSITNFLGKDFKIDLYSNWDRQLNWRNADGWDFEILKWGTHSKCEDWNLTCSFDIDIKLSNETKQKLANKTISSEKMFDEARKEINKMFYVEQASKVENSNQYSFSVDEAVNKIFDLFQTNHIDFSSGAYKMFNNYYSWSLNYKNSNSDFKIYNEPKLDSLNTNFENIDSDNVILFDRNLKSNFISLNSFPIGYSNEFMKGITIYNNEILNSTSGTSNTKLRDIVNQRDFRVVVEYNNNPLFLINEPISLGTNGGNVNQIIRKYFFNKDEPTDDDLNKMVNFSQKFFSYQYNLTNTDTSYFNIVKDESDKNKISKLDETSDVWKFNYVDNDGYLEQYIKPKLPKEAKGQLDGFKINAIVDVYNNILAGFKNSAANIKDLNKPEDVVFLYNQFPGQILKPMDMKYREFMSDGKDQILSLYSGRKVSLFDNENALNIYKQDNVPKKPAKVIIFENELGQIINPGIKKSEDGKLIYTSDAVYDSEETILKNLENSIVVPKSTTKVYYREDNGDYKPLTRDINQIYILRIKDTSFKPSENDTEKERYKDYYFPSYNDAWKYLDEYLKTRTKVIKLI